MVIVVTWREAFTNVFQAIAFLGVGGVSGAVATLVACRRGWLGGRRSS